MEQDELPSGSSPAGVRSEGLRERWRNHAGYRSFGILACVLSWIILAGHLALHLPVEPRIMGDSQDYLTLASHRPPFYGWILAGYQWATGSLRFLPLFQFLVMSLCMLLFAAELGLLLESSLVGPVAIALCLMHPTIHDASQFIETEPVFLALVLAGLGLLFRSARSSRSRRASLTGAAVLFALAAATRTTGVAFLLLTPLVAAFDRRVRWRVGLTQGGLSLAAMALVLVIAMAGNWTRNNRFEIGSFGGVALLGKGLMLIEPSDLPKLPQGARIAAAETLASAIGERAIMEASPDLASAMRAQLQISEDLRFAVFFPAAVKTWPEFASADWRERAVLSSGVARPLILAHPLGYARLWARDWGALVLYPNFWPGWATGKAPARSRFAACRMQNNCYSLDRYDLPAPALVSLLFTSVAGTIMGLLVILTQAPKVLRRRADPRTTLFFGCAVVLHVSLLVSAAAECGFVRYTLALHVLDIALVLWLVLAVIRRFGGAVAAYPR